jgi:hypothetical protein
MFDESIASATTIHCGMHLRIYPDIQIVTSIAWPTKMAEVMW